MKTGGDKSRILVLFLFLIILIIGIVFAFLGLKKHQEAKEGAGAALKAAPSGISSIPGGEAASEEYIKTQQQENILKAEAAAERAKKEGKSAAAIPVITRPVFQSSSDITAGATKGTPRVGCSPEDIKRARAAGVNASELRCKGCTVEDLKAIFTAAELKDAGFTAAELKAAGFSAEALKEAGFSAKEMLDAGFTANELKNSGYTVAELKAAGLSLNELQKLGATAQELHAAGFTAAEMKAAGFSTEELKKAGFSAKELKDAGASIQELSDAGFSPMELIEAGATDEELAKVGIQPDQIKALRAKLAEEKAKMPKDCSIGALTKARTDGVSATSLAELKCGAAALRAAGYTAAQLKAAGFSAKDLRSAGFTPAELKEGGYNAAELKALGLTAKELKDAGFSAEDLKAAGLSIQELKEAGYSAGELKAAGFTPAELRQAGYDAAELLKAGITPAELRAAGYSAEEMKAAGMDLADIKKAGFTDGELIRAGFTAEEVNPPSLKPGLTPAELRAAGYTAEKMKAAGMSLADIKKAGFTDEELKRAGFTAAEINALPPSSAQPATAVETKVEVIPAAPASTTKSLSGLETTQPGENLSDTEKALRQLQERQALQASAEQRNELLQQIQVSMLNQANELISSWVPPPTQKYEVHEAPKEKGGSGGTGGTGGRGTGRGGESGGPAANANVVKAGAVMFAVLDTGINSDEASPILATIVQGPLKGAKLLGQFARTEKKVVLSFTTMSLPQYPSSFPVNAVAIDPDTARTAMASEVNSHYLLRYGSLFAASFVSGYATAVMASGSTTTINPLGGSVVTTPPLDGSQKAAIALGNVGTQYSTEMNKNFSVPPTVIVHSGAGLGILFMADLPLPKEIPVQAAGGVHM